MQIKYLVLFTLALLLIFANFTEVSAAKKRGKRNKKKNTIVEDTPKKEEKIEKKNEQPPKKNKAASGSKNWNKINYNDLEKEWEQDDEEDELEMEFERNRRINQSKQPKIDVSDPKSIRKAMDVDPLAFSGGGGTTMMFVDLAKSRKWSSKEIDDLSKRFAALLRSGSIEATPFNIGNNRLLINVDKSWYTKDTLKFLANREEVDSVTINSKVHTRQQLRTMYGNKNNDDDEDDEDL